MTSWEWLSEPLALDAANTRRWADGTNTEFLTGPEDLAAWLRQVTPRLPRHLFELPTSLTERDLTCFRELRDVLIDVLGAAAMSKAADTDDLVQLSELRLRHPVLDVVDGAGTAWAAGPSVRGMSALIGLIAAEAIRLLGQHDTDLAVCPAPGCHWLYLRTRPNQRWCDPGCGNRARVHRHKERHRSALR